ncbi:MAG: hypothetical protein U1F36_07075 [Planctomycetota bacterium]
MKLSWCAPLLLGMSLAAQALPTTLVEFTRRADCIVRARVLLVRDDGEGGRSAVFLTQEVLRGDAPRTFGLAENGIAGCTSTIARLLPGSGVLLFLDRQDAAFAPCNGDPRAVAPLEPGLVEHCRTLLAMASQPVQLRAGLFAALDIGSPRARQDAATELTRSPALLDATLLERAILRRELEAEITRPDAAALALINAAARLVDSELDGLLLAAALDGRCPTLTPVITHELAVRPPEALAQLVARALAAAPQRASAALRMATGLPAANAAAVRAALRSAPDPLVRALEQRSSPSAEAPVFRSIQPRSR